MKRAVLRTISSLGLLVLCGGCGDQASTSAPKAGNTSPTASPATQTSKPDPVKSGESHPAQTRDQLAQSPAESAPEVGENATSPDASAFAASPVETFVDAGPPAKPATAAEAAKVIDLRTFPLVATPKLPPSRSLAILNYSAPGKILEAYKFIQEKLLAQKWQELPGSYTSEQSANGTFARDGYKISVSVFEAGGGDGAGEVQITMINHGNVSAASLPVPEGAKPFFNTPVSSAYLTDASVDETVAATRKLFLDAGWEPYGVAGDSYDFKQNNIKVGARVAAAPAQGGKTMIDYSTLLLAVDIPAPPEATLVHYSDTPAQLSFDFAGSYEDVTNFYREKLAAQNWKPTTKELVKIDWKSFLIFRNPDKDLLEVQFTTVDDKTRILVKFQTEAELEELEKAAKEEVARKKAEAEKPKPKLTITLPEDATDVKKRDGHIEFTVEVGQAKAAVEALQKQLVDAGWEAGDATMEAMFGNIMLKKDGHSVSLTYIESGVLAPEITISAIGVELETADE